MTLASSGIKRRQLPPSITAAPCRKGAKEEESWKKRGMDEAGQGAGGWEAISTREERRLQPSLGLVAYQR